jgi:hypothetical protein
LHAYWVHLTPPPALIVEGTGTSTAPVPSLQDRQIETTIPALDIQMSPLPSAVNVHAFGWWFGGGGLSNTERQTRGLEGKWPLRK